MFHTYCHADHKLLIVLLIPGNTAVSAMYVGFESVK